MWGTAWLACALDPADRPGHDRVDAVRGRFGHTGIRPEADSGSPTGELGHGSSYELESGEWLLVKTYGSDWDVDGPPFEVVAPDGRAFPSFTMSSPYVSGVLVGQRPPPGGDGSNGTDHFVVLRADVAGTYRVDLFDEGEIDAVIGPASSPWELPPWFAPVYEFESVATGWLGPATSIVDVPSIAWVYQPMGSQPGLAFHGPDGVADLPTDASEAVYLAPGEWTLPSDPDHVTVIRSVAWRFDERDGPEDPRNDCVFDIGGLPGEGDVTLDVGPLACLTVPRDPVYIRCSDARNGAQLPGFSLRDSLGNDVTTTLDPCERYTLVFDAPADMPWNCSVNLGYSEIEYADPLPKATCQPAPAPSPSARQTPRAGCGGCASTTGVGDASWTSVVFVLALRRRSSLSPRPAAAAPPPAARPGAAARRAPRSRTPDPAPRSSPG